MDLIVQQIIQMLRLQPLPGEGGLFRETYRSEEIVPAAALPERYSRPGAPQKPFGTAIFYLLTNQPVGTGEETFEGDPASGESGTGRDTAFSALHRLPTDEIYHFYLGDPLEMTLLLPGGSSRQAILGQDLLNGQQVQYVVPRGAWQGARLVTGGRFALVGTTMAPGFTSQDYEHGDRAALLAQYPHERERILALTR